jgi:hypothetical protein
MLLLTPRHSIVPFQLTFIVHYAAFALELGARPNKTTNFGATHAFTFVTACKLVPLLYKVYQWASDKTISHFTCHLTTGLLAVIRVELSSTGTKKPSLDAQLYLVKL